MSFLSSLHGALRRPISMCRSRRAGITEVTLALMLVASSGCTPPADGPSAEPEVDRATVDREVRLLLDQWVDAFESRDPAAVEAVLSDGPDFVWLEDGDVRYPNRETILTALAGFPPDLVARYALDDIEVLPIGAEHAWARMTTQTEIEQGGEVVSSFAGVVTMLVENGPSGWRIAAAHTSNRRPR